MSNDSVADLLTRVRNAQKIGQKSVRVRSSRVCRDVLGILKQEGFIVGFSEVPAIEGSFKELMVDLKYYGPYDPVISEARKISTSGRRRYLRCSQLSKVSQGLGISIVSTSQGILSDREARKRNIGGEVLAKIF